MSSLQDLPQTEGADIQNCVVALPKVVDRSPCGTGTSAKSALLFAEGKLKVGENFVHESVTDPCLSVKL